MRQEGTGARTSMRPTTMEREGIYNEMVSASVGRSYSSELVAYDTGR